MKFQPRALGMRGLGSLTHGSPSQAMGICSGEQGAWVPILGPLSLPGLAASLCLFPQLQEWGGGGVKNIGNCSLGCW